MADSIILFLISFLIAFAVPLLIYVILSNTSRDAPTKTKSAKKKKMMNTKKVLKIYDSHEFNYIRDQATCANAEEINIQLNELLINFRTDLKNASTVADAQSIIFELQNSFNSLIIDGTIQDQNIAQMLYQSVRTLIEELLQAL